MSKIATLLAFVAVLLLCAAPAQGQKNLQYAFKMDAVETPNAPTLNATLEWMQNTAPNHAFVRLGILGFHYYSDRTQLTFHGCTAKVSIHLVYSYGDPVKPATHEETYDYSFRLGDLDPDSVVLNDESLAAPWIVLRTSDERETIASLHSIFRHEMPQKYATDPGQPYQRNNVQFTFDSVEYDKRFARAMKHAITLCGGKASTF